MTNPLYWLVTITDRRSTDAFLALYESYGVRVSLRTVGAGTAVQEMLATLGLEKSEKAVLFAIITADTWPKIQKALRRQMRIDVPGTGIAFIIPVSSMGGKRALQFLTEHQTFTRMEESTLKDTHYELLLVIANQGYTFSTFDLKGDVTEKCLSGKRFGKTFHSKDIISADKSWFQGNAHLILNLLWFINALDFIQHFLAAFRTLDGFFPVKGF